MANMKYVDFEIAIEKEGDEYYAQVLHSPHGQARVRFQNPLSAMELENFWLKAVRGSTVRSGSVGDSKFAKEVGGRLYRSVFTGEVETCFQTSLARAQDEPNTGLRIRLRLSSAPELAALPWEYLYQERNRRFLALTSATPVVRFLDRPDRTRPLRTSPPLRVLVMISSPRGVETLDSTAEWERMKRAFTDLEASGAVILEKLPDATLDTLRWTLRAGEYHIFHFIGHGLFDPDRNTGFLILEDGEGNAVHTSAERLGVILHDERTLRLVVLNACEGGRAAESDIFAGAAQTLVQQDIPAVVAMQFEFTDRAAIAFTHEFYRSIVFGDPVDTALTQARQAIYTSGNEVEWGTPVLYMQTDDGHLFEFEAAKEASGDSVPQAGRRGGSPSPSAPPPTPPPPAREELLNAARLAMKAESWDEASDRAHALLARDSADPDALAMIRQIEDERRLAARYREASGFATRGQWKEAAAAFDEVQRVRPAYRDVDVQIRRVQLELERIARADAPGQTVASGPLAAIRERFKRGVMVGGGILAVLAIIGILVPDEEPYSPYEPVLPEVTPDTPPVAQMQPFASLTAPSSSGGNWWRDAEAAAVGYSPWTDLHIGNLNGGDQQFVDMSFDQPGDYLLLGACDGDCSDLDLEMFEGDRSVAADYKVDDVPALQVIIVSPTQGQLKVSMASCSVNPCQYQVRTYRR
ncbi:MAG: CHAT domain-containing protein [Gemmatimonadetes bacterium]|nr:CHAT domain-containing protein [Gemmatimonadota bacterium]